jgi:hypothetical protein
MTDVSEVLTVSIIGAIQRPEDSHLQHHRSSIFNLTVSTSETQVNLYQNTRRNNPEDSHVQHCPLVGAVPGSGQILSNTAVDKHSD